MNYNDKLIFTIDLDAFFASCEELRHPEYKGSPMVVAHDLNGKGVVLAANYEARAYDIKAGMPLFKVKQILPNINRVDVDHEYYQEKANEVFKVIMTYSDKIQIASIDECHVDVTHLTEKHTPIEIAKMIQFDVKNQLNLSVSIGISTNILLSKVASNFDKPFGITTLYKHEIPTKLWTLPVGEMYMIGRKSSPKFNELGIMTIGDLALLRNDPEKYSKAKQVFGINLDKHIEASNGLSTDVVITEETTLKSLSKDKTYPHSIKDLDSLILNTRDLYDFAMYRCERRKLMPSVVSVSIKLDKSFNRKSISKKMRIPSMDKAESWPLVVDALERLFKEGDSVKFSSVTLDGLKPAEKTFTQITLDDTSTKSKPRLQQIAEKTSMMLGTEVMTASTMEDNRRYEDTEPVMRDNIKFKVWDK